MMAWVGNKLILDDVSVAVDQNFGIDGDGKQSKFDSEHSGSDTEEVFMWFQCLHWENWQWDWE